MESWDEMAARHKRQLITPMPRPYRKPMTRPSIESELTRLGRHWNNSFARWLVENRGLDVIASLGPMFWVSGINRSGTEHPRIILNTTGRYPPAIGDPHRSPEVELPDEATALGILASIPTPDVMAAFAAAGFQFTTPTGV